jgi:hypothetical protein
VWSGGVTHEPSTTHADLEVVHRLGTVNPSLPAPAATALIDEGNQISRMEHSLMQRLGTSQPRSS